VCPINLYGEFITHKSFGRGQIIEHDSSFVTVLFCDTNDKKKFIYPSAIETFLMLEDTGTAKLFKEYSDEMTDHLAAAQKAAADRLNLERFAMRAEALKKAKKRPIKKAKPS
jgi:hypothetical protein